MRRIRYSVAMSLDGYIAGPEGEFDWIIMDPDFDFSEIYSQFDTILMGRRTFETTHALADAAQQEEMQITFSDMKTFVFSRTLQQGDYPNVTIVGDNFAEMLTALREAPGKDIWLFGGGSLFRSLAEAGFVDKVDVGVMPVLLGGGLPLLPPPAKRIQLKLTSHKAYPKSGTLGLEYEVKRTAG